MGSKQGKWRRVGQRHIWSLWVFSPILTVAVHFLQLKMQMKINFMVMLKYLIRSDADSFQSCVSSGNKVPLHYYIKTHLWFLVGIDTFALFWGAMFNWHNFLNYSYLLNINSKVQMASFLCLLSSWHNPWRRVRVLWQSKQYVCMLGRTEICSPSIAQVFCDPAGAGLVFSKLTSLCALVFVRLHGEIKTLK